MRDGRAGQRGIPATRGLSASASACHRLGGEVTAARPCVSLPGAAWGASFLTWCRCLCWDWVCSAPRGWAGGPSRFAGDQLPPCTLWQPDGPTRRSSCFVWLQFAPGSSQPGQGGDEPAAAPGPNSWRVPEGSGLWGEATGSVCGDSHRLGGEVTTRSICGGKR